MATEATRGRSHTAWDSSNNLDLSLGNDSGNDAGAISIIPSNNETRHLDTQTYRIETLSPIRANTKKGRVTHRRLLPIHVFMIAVNATLGTGLYWRGGQILELGGFLAVIISFLLLGILAWLVTQCITELLCIWPVPGAMSVFVREFVDFELGITVGVAYWFTYSVSFAALIAYTAEEVHYWTSDAYVGIDVGVLYLLVPVILIVLNCFGIHVYGWFEVVTGIIKLLFLAIIGIATLIFATKTPQDTNEKHSWTQPITFDDTAASSWFPALCICLSTATFAYVGVEVPAAAALEARPTTASAHKRNQASNIGETIRFPSKWISVFACIAYTLSGILVSLSVDPTDCRLPRVGWLNYDSCETVQSAFVLVAKVRGSAEIASAFNAFLVFTALSCANTNLYVASRTLFGLTNQIDGGPDEPWYLNILAWLGRTNSYRVPIRAMTVSAIAFIWVPFLQLNHPDQSQIGSSQESQTGDNGSKNRGIGAFINILAEMGSVGVLIAWACECWAFIRYYHCISKHHNELVERKVSRVQRFSDRDDNDYPYISNGQPVTAYLGLGGCLLILLVLDGAALWNGFYTEPFLSSYLLVAIFVLVWVALKLWRGAKWSLVDLSNPDLAIGIIRGLHESSYAGFQAEPNPNRRRGSSVWALRQLSITPSAPARNGG
ncbi:amino acid permease-domain-containing protein [Daldinia vernicosa]|uniref:amino acid permease-domain-containing protein n=1 Tax=Daldinia vernicosa TaxID=114800 RepID=UPI0020086D0A|nr:amino acid permease-domain-containing protein [Daldinia vernicosa]KAI0854225.1 amino acid permease-domain-containing protein [Daldinia vernicosa]